MDIEQVAETSPDKIITTKIDFSSDISDENIKKILSPFDLEKKQMSEGYNLVRAIFKTLISKDASLIEINPLIITKKQNIICLDAKISFDDNALFRRPEILKLEILTRKIPQKSRQANTIYKIEWKYRMYG